MSHSKQPNLNHMLSMDVFDQSILTYLLDRSESFLPACKKNEIIPACTGQVIVNLFFESSTRTRNSFEIAAKRLNAIVLSPDMQQSATQKGELLIDTIRNFEAMDARLLIVRHSDNNLAQFLASELNSGTPVVNAGDGSNEHPTQAIVDLLTIRQHFPNFSDLTVAIIGDIVHSRVARSLITGLRIMGVKRIRIIAPEAFMPNESDIQHVDQFSAIDAGLEDVDVIYTLRIQKERFDTTQHPDDGEYFKSFGLTQERLKIAKPTAIVMHSGPIIRGVEIESVVADGPQSVILQQTQNSVAARMAVIETLLKQS